MSLNCAFLIFLQVYGTVRAMPSVLHGEQGVGGRVRGNVPKLATTTTVVMFRSELS